MLAEWITTLFFVVFNNIKYFIIKDEVYFILYE